MLGWWWRLRRFRGVVDACLAGLRAAVIVAVAGRTAWWCEAAGGGVSRLRLGAL